MGGALPCQRRYRRPDWEPVHTPPAPAAQRLPGTPVRAEAALELGSALCLDRAFARRAMTCADTSSCSRGSPSNKTPGRRPAPRRAASLAGHLRQEGPSPAGRAPCAWPWGQESARPGTARGAEGGACPLRPRLAPPRAQTGPSRSPRPGPPQLCPVRPAPAWAKEKAGARGSPLCPLPPLGFQTKGEAVAAVD